MRARPIEISTILSITRLAVFHFMTSLSRSMPYSATMSFNSSSESCASFARSATSPSLATAIGSITAGGLLFAPLLAFEAPPVTAVDPLAGTLELAELIAVQSRSANCGFRSASSLTTFARLRRTDRSVINHAPNPEATSLVNDSRFSAKPGAYPHFCFNVISPRYSAASAN